MITTREKTSLTATSVLSPAQKQHYLNEGYVVLPNFVKANVCEAMVEYTYKLMENWDDSGTRIIFSTLEQHHEKTNYFLDSGDKIRFFFEEGAIDTDGKLKKDKKYCINKIGHALHDLDPFFYCFSRQHKLAQLSKDLDIIDPLLVQSMYICKQPLFGGEVTPHQDSTYLFVKDRPITGFWIALQDATLQNGCLWVLPGYHQAPLKKTHAAQS